MVFATATVAPVDELPLNRWVELLPGKEGEGRREAGYTYSQPVYVSSRGQVLHWGAVAGGDARPWMRNDVRAFHAGRLAWISDYPRAETLPGLATHSSNGKGISYRGTGVMLDCGTPAPSMIAGGVCHDTRRDQVIYTMKGLMAAYDPGARRWRDLGAKTILNGKEYPGGPPLYGMSTGYDPVNDEIVLFPHWGGFNADLRPVSGRISGHCGTFIYSFGENAWRRVSRGMGGENARRDRKKILEEMAGLSRRMDEDFASRRGAGPGSAGLRKLEERLAGLALEPPPRCGTPLIYDPGNRALVMFGGHSGLVRTDLGAPARPGALNDTWLYEVEKKRWRRLICQRRPPPTLWPKMAHDPASGLVLLVRRTHPWAGRNEPRVITLWGLDVGESRWSKLHEQPWTWDYSDARATGWRPDPFEIALDERAGLLILTQNVRRGKEPVEQIFAFRLDVAGLNQEPAPRWKPPPPVRPMEIPPGDPAWIARLGRLPANRWIHARPPREPADRGWGVLACDPLRGWAVYFGGGHATYQVNNPDVYVAGANRWVTTAGEHNDWIPPVGWGGVAMGYRGGRHAHHQRNEYVALDGRMYWSVGTGSRRWRADAEKQPGPRYSWFFDIDRGGVWRQVEIGRVEMGKGVPGTYGKPSVVFPDGRVIAFGGALEPYDGRFFEGESYAGIFNIYANTLTLRRVPPPGPGIVLECRPFCALPRRNQVFFYECVVRNGKAVRKRTWLYDIGSNRFIDLKPVRQPAPAEEPGTVVYLEDQDAVFAALGRDRQWIYSFRHNTWTELPLESDGPMAFAEPYCQVVYVARYGVLVSAGSASRGTALLRPDLSRIRWE